MMDIPNISSSTCNDISVELFFFLEAHMWPQAPSTATLVELCAYKFGLVWIRVYIFLYILYRFNSNCTRQVHTLSTLDTTFIISLKLINFKRVRHKPY